MTTSFESFLSTWDREATKTSALLRALPKDQYDFRPDAGGRSLGELAWHLAEVEAFITFGVANGGFDTGKKPEGVKRPATVEPLATEYERVHGEARERLKFLTEADMDRTVKFTAGNLVPIGALLRDMLLLHVVHHRGQLTVLARLSGGVPAGTFGPSREERQKPANP